MQQKREARYYQSLYHIFLLPNLIWIEGAAGADKVDPILSDYLYILSVYHRIIASQKRHRPINQQKLNR